MLSLFFPTAFISSRGFTNDKQLLLTALDPEGHTPHMPKVFLYSASYGIGDPNYYLAIMKDIAHYLDGYPGRKNIIWVARNFPFAVFAGQESPDTTVDTRDVRGELAEMAAPPDRHLPRRRRGRSRNE